LTEQGPASPARLPRSASGELPGSGRLAERRVVVVGAGTRPSTDQDAPIGNGRAISVLAAREGASVACLDLDPAAARATADLAEAEGVKAIVVAGDAADATDAGDLVAEAATGLGGIDGLVLNVGIGKGSGMAGTTPEDWDETFAVNVRAHFLCSRAALTLMPEGGSIVFIGSVAGLKPGSRIPAYDASKAALGGLCRHLAAAGARHGVRANLVAPGLIDTPLGRWASAGRPSRTRTAVPLGREGTAWEVAEAVVWLLSDNSSYVTGQTLAVDGGLSTL
jgi:NAD(P)-dependent dehydrogenase (short-subunit alcohol dehydrogenase family)